MSLNALRAGGGTIGRCPSVYVIGLNMNGLVQGNFLPVHMHS